MEAEFVFPGWPNNTTPAFVPTKGQYPAWGRVRWNPIGRCLVTKAPRYTLTSVPLSEAACGERGWGGEG